MGCMQRSARFFLKDNINILLHIILFYAIVYYTVYRVFLIMATVQFSLNAQQFKILQRLSNPGESLNLTAKRVLSAALVSSNLSNNINALEPESTLDIGLTSTERQFRQLDDCITAIEVGIETDHYSRQDELPNSAQSLAELEERIEKIEIDRLNQDHRFGVHIETLEDRIDKLETEIEMITTPKQPATPNNAELVIFLADPEGEPIQFWSGQVWVDGLDLAYRYKAQQALARAIAKLKKRKLPGNVSPGTAIAFAPIENLLENYQRKILLGKLASIPCAPIENLLTSQDYNSSAP